MSKKVVVYNTKKVGVKVADIVKYMRNNRSYHLDTRTEEVNHTSLAEDAACHFDLYENTVDYTIPEIVFELAGDIK